MTVNILVCGFCLVALIGQELKCDAEALISATFAVETLIEDWLPRDTEFDASCVAEGCPALKNMSFCPSDLGIDALKDITKTISECMSGPICGVVIDPRPIKYMVLSMDDYLPNSVVKGIMTLPPAAGVFSNISTIHLATSNESQRLPLEMTMVIPNMRVHGRYLLQFHLKTPVGLDLAANLTQATYDINIQFSSIVKVNQSGPHVDFTFVNPIIKSDPDLCGNDLPGGFPSIQALYTESVRKVFDNAPFSKAIALFMGKLYRSSIEVALSNCKSLNATI